MLKQNSIEVVENFHGRLVYFLLLYFQLVKTGQIFYNLFKNLQRKRIHTC